MQIGFRRRAVMGAALLLAAGMSAAVPAVPAAAAPAAAADPAATVTVNARAGLATVPDTALGVNDAIWDAELGTTAVSDLLGAAGVQMVRYPGGSYADIYHWRDHTAPGGYVAPNTDFDTFMASVRRINAQPMIIANYGTGTAEEAAGWVRYANVTKGYGAKYWTIGNENYGNGHYGSAWEADNHADKSPRAYAEGVVAFATAMKAVDPTIKIGAVLTTPGNWPDGLVGSGDAGTWNQVVLSVAGPSIDFVDLHWYPGGGTAAEALTKTDQVDDIMYLTRQQLARHAGPGAATRIKVSFTELNVGVGLNTQPGALFLADTYSSLLNNGVFTAQWWNVHNGIGTVSTVAGQTDYGDFGLLSSGGCQTAGGSDGTVCEPPMNTPFAPYHALTVMKSFIRTGDQLVRAGTTDPLVSAHAARRPNGDLAVLLINKDPANAKPVSLQYAGYSPAAAAPTVITFGNGDAAPSTATTGTAAAQTLAPYSLTLLLLHPSASTTGAPGAPGQPTTTTVAANTATIAWPAASPGAAPIAKYEVYRQHGTTSEQLGETPGTSLQVHNLNPGTRYTVNVITRDTAGRVSWSSPPLTFTTATPTTSTCTVRFTDVNDWGNGYVGNLDITNTGAAPINGWTLTFTWPTTWQTINGSWNANWTQTGRDVKITNLDTSPTLPAAGGSTSTGFVGAYNGPNVLPTTFRLNGTVCTTL